MTLPHMQETLKVKASLLGGSKEHLKFGELREAIRVLDELKHIALHLRPHMNVLNPRRLNEQPSGEDLTMRLATATRALKEVAPQLGNLFSSHGSALSLESFEVYLRELRRFIYWGENVSVVNFAEKWSSFLRAFKSATVSPPNHLLFQHEWVNFFESVALWYGIWLQFRVDFSLSEIFYGVESDKNFDLLHQLCPHL